MICIFIYTSGWWRGAHSQFLIINNKHVCLESCDANGMVHCTALAIDLLYDYCGKSGDRLFKLV